MPSRLRDIMAEYNALVDQAQQLGIRFGKRYVRRWTKFPASIAEGQKRLDALNAKIAAAQSTQTTADV